MKQVLDRFLTYVKIDTQSEYDAASMPSTAKQFDLSRLLASELTAMGAADVAVSEHAYVTATIPANTAEKKPVVGFIAHVDTSNAVSGANVQPVVTARYDGGDIPMGGDYVLSPADYPALRAQAGHTVICSNGSTLLGADDKAGVAEIMTLCERLLAPDAPKHGTVRIGFTPDEEIGCGVDGFDVAGFHADFAYTVDGGELGEINFENFNAAGAVVTVKGLSTHTGAARGKMVNAALVCMELQAMLPRYMDPACTDGYEGFFHLERMTAHTDRAEMHYIVRDHDRALFEEKKRLLAAAVDYLNRAYGAGTVTLAMSDTYYNMKEKIDPSLICAAEKAMAAVGVTPILAPIRGGTDGARLSFMGLPCPNLCTGGHNFHSRYEFISAEDMEKVVDILTALATSF